MSRVRIAALAALLAIPSAAGARAIGHPDAEVGPVQTVAAAGHEVAITTDVRPTTATPGEPVTITVTVRDVARRLAVVDVQLYDPAGVRAFRRSWGVEASDAGQQPRRQTAWTVPDNARPGDWMVKASVLESDRRRPTTWNEPAIPIFPPPWGEFRAWSQAAARLTVRSAPPPVHFSTLPPRATLPSGARCAAWVRAWSFPEGKRVNRTANQRTGHRLGPDFFDPAATDPRAARLAARVDGAFTGTTEQILR